MLMICERNMDLPSQIRCSGESPAFDRCSCRRITRLWPDPISLLPKRQSNARVRALNTSNLISMSYKDITPPEGGKIIVSAGNSCS